ncbi:hypothetical protein PPH93_18280 [Achromobacter xylosoxidans]|uniref:hypothetical protein n=1 Tax=Alcaligenes xylosoxydans xylosoxydans TaxID=85698 RepID=UPI00234B705E|nr:hypothetical protein [Achromobacter xylosoxidans]MDC6163607.1 hypothetical protein [Achromobacter xylosoxidans]
MKPPVPLPRPRPTLRRLLAVLALLAGGLGAEAVQPGPCQLIVNSQDRCRTPPAE